MEIERRLACVLIRIGYCKEDQMRSGHVKVAS